MSDDCRASQGKDQEPTERAGASKEGREADVEQVRFHDAFYDQYSITIATHITTSHDHQIWGVAVMTKIPSDDSRL